MPKTPAPAAEIPADVAGAAAAVATGKVPAATLVEELFALNAQVNTIAVQIAEKKASLIACGPDKYTGTDPAHVLTVVGATLGSAGKVFYTLSDEDEAKEAAMLARARELADDKFGVLFERHISYLPIEGFASVVPTHLTPAKARDLLSLCGRQGAGSSGKAPYILGLPKS